MADNNMYTVYVLYLDGTVPSNPQRGEADLDHCANNAVRPWFNDGRHSFVYPLHHPRPSGDLTVGTTCPSPIDDLPGGIRH